MHGTPDTLNVQMDVASQATHASDALSQDESETNSLIQTLSGSGVNQSDIQTASLSIDPIYGSDGQSITVARSSGVSRAGSRAHGAGTISQAEVATPVAASRRRRRSRPGRS